MDPMTNEASAPVTLLVHDGELCDVRDLLARLGTSFVERRGAPADGDRDAHWDLVISTPNQLLALHLQNDDKPPRQIAICDQDSRTLRASLQRAGIQLMVRRPVHPAALRALIVHALYRGPEKRRSRRVSVGAPVRYRIGWSQRSAILADLSLGGCRLLASEEIERGRALRLLVDPALAGGKAFSVRARSLGSSPAGVGAAGTIAFTAKFERVSPRLAEKIGAMVSAHVSGPATFSEEIAQESAGPAGEAPPTPTEQVAPEPPRQMAPLAEDRRQGERREIEHRVAGLDEEATRILMGRDISLGGMRVDPNPRLRLGECLDLAIHVEGRKKPLVLGARVHRNDGERGVVLRFLGVPSETARELTDLMAAMPLIDPAEGSGGVLVSEILENGAR
jgi:hypothetical protein